MSVPGDRVLQSSAFARAAVPLAVSSLVLGMLLSGFVGELFPEPLRPWAPVLVGALVVAAAIGGGLAWAFPRVRVDAAGALRVRGRTIPPGEIVAADRRLSSSYLSYRLRTADGFRVRVLAAGFPVRGMSPVQLTVLRELVAASSIPVAEDPAELRRTLAGDGALGAGRLVEVDRTHLEAEIAALLGEPAAEDPVGQPDAGHAAAVDAGHGGESREPLAALQARAEVDDLAALARIQALPAWPWVLRRIALVLLVLSVLAAAGLLVALVVMEAGGTDFGAADEDPLVFAMLVMFGVVLAAWMLWAVCADLSDGQVRRDGLLWIEHATPEQRELGLPTPYHAVCARAPGGRLLQPALFVAAVLGGLAVIVGFFFLGDDEFGPVVGAFTLFGGVVVLVAAIVGLVARRGAAKSRMAWLVAAAGLRVTGPTDR